jgi:ArsR family transcriptional regulator
MAAAQAVVKLTPRSAKRPPSQKLDVDEAALLFRLVGDPTRMAILEELSHGECCVCDLADVLGITQPLLSHHLRQLRNGGLIKDRRSGRWAYYVSVPGAFDALMATLTDLRGPKPARRRDCKP